MATWADNINARATGKQPTNQPAGGGASPAPQVAGWAARLNSTVQTAQKLQLVPQLNTNQGSRPGLAFQAAQSRAKGISTIPTKLPKSASIGAITRDPVTKRLYKFTESGWQEVLDPKNFPAESLVPAKGRESLLNPGAESESRGLIEQLGIKIGETMERAADPNRRGQLAKDVGYGALDFGKSVLRAFPRAAMSTAITLTGHDDITPGEGFIKGDPVAEALAKTEKFVFGKDPIKNIRREGEDLVTQLGGDQRQVQEYGLVVGALSTGLDLIPGIPKKKIAQKLAEEGAVPAVKKLLAKEVFKNAPDDLLEAMARKFAPIKNKKLIEEELAFYQKVDRTKLQGLGLNRSNEEILQGRYNALIDQQMKSDPNLIKVVNETAKQTKEPPGVVTKVLSSLGDIKTGLVEYVQNEQERVRQLVGKKGMKVDDISDPYLKATLYPGRVAERVNQGKKVAEEVVGDANKLAKDLKVDIKQARKDINDYLYFKHAPERNAALGENAAGITTQEAIEGMARFDNSPQGQRVAEIAGKVANLHKETLDMLKNSGVISNELYSTLKTKYQNHVPLNRILEETDDVGAALSGKGFDVRSSGIMKAVGSDKEVDDILSNVINNYEQAVLRSEKNIVDQATLSFVRKNKDELGDLITETRPKIIGNSFDGGVLYQKTNDPTILQMFEDGKPVWLKIQDPKLAVALRAVGREKLGGLMNAVASFTRLYSGLATRFNPEFALPNKLRDLQETAVHLAAQKDVGFTGAAKTVARDLSQQNTKAIIDYMRGADTEGARLYKELKELGGTTGGFGLSTKAETKIALEKMEKLATSKTRKIGDKLIEYVDNWNTIFEDSTRLSVYRQGLKQGLSKDRAAALAKEASINFNRMGKGGPVINALWMFSNASIQGSTKMIRALKNPKVLAATALTVGGSVAAVNEWNDRVDPDWRNKVTKWDRLNGLPVMLPNQDGDGANYFTIPVSWGIKPIKVMADYTFDSMGGRNFDVKDFVGQTLTSMIEAYNPVGGTDLTSALTPTLLDIPSEISRNQSWSGSKIKPDFDKNAPADVQYFDSLGDTTTGKIAISISELLQSKTGIAISPADIKYAFDGYVGGAGRAVSKTSNLISAVGKGELPPTDELPMVSRFYRKRTQEEIDAQGSTEESDILKQQLTEQSRSNFKLKQQAESLLEQYKKLPKDEANAKAAILADENPQLFEKLKTAVEDDKAGLNRTERLVKELGVENGQRAKYIYDKVQAFGSKEEKNAYIQNLINKKVVTDEVFEQLQELVANPPKKQSAAPKSNPLADAGEAIGGAFGAIGDAIVPTAAASEGEKFPSFEERVKEAEAQDGGLFGSSTTITDYRTGQEKTISKKGAIEKGIKAIVEFLTGKKPDESAKKLISSQAKGENVPEMQVITPEEEQAIQQKTVSKPAVTEDGKVDFNAIPRDQKYATTRKRKNFTPNQPPADIAKIIKKHFGDEYPTAVIVAATENGEFDPKRADNVNKNDGSRDRGIFQINSSTFNGLMERQGAKLKAYGIDSYEDMYDPDKNAYVAKLIKEGSKQANPKTNGWGGWFGWQDTGYDINNGYFSAYDRLYYELEKRGRLHELLASK